MLSVARLVWLIAVSKDIRLLYEHVSGTDNCIADDLSRVFECSLSNMRSFKHFTWFPVGLAFYPNMFV